MEFTAEEKLLFSKMGKESVKKRGLSEMTPEERSSYMSSVRKKGIENKKLI